MKMIEKDKVIKIVRAYFEDKIKGKPDEEGFFTINIKLQREVNELCDLLNALPTEGEAIK